MPTYFIIILWVLNTGTPISYTMGYEDLDKCRKAASVASEFLLESSEDISQYTIIEACNRDIVWIVPSQNLN